MWKGYAHSLSKSSGYTLCNRHYSKFFRYSHEQNGEMQTPWLCEHALWRKTGKELHYTVVIRHRSKITHNMCLLVCSTNRPLLPSSPFEVEETEAQKSWILFPAHLANKKQSCWPSCPAVWCQSLCSYLPFYPMHCHQLASGETSKTHPVAFSTGLTGRTDMYT